MATSLRQRLHGKEVEIIATLKEIDIDDCMVMYSIKHRPTFIKWLKESCNIEWTDKHPLANIKGGTKVMWNREHRELILNYMEVFGFEKTRITFNFDRRDTLERFLQSDEQPHADNLTPIERLKLENKDMKARLEELEKWREWAQLRFQLVSQERASEQKAVTELNESYANFTTDVSSQLAQGFQHFFKALLERGLRLDRRLPAPRETSEIDEIIEGAERTIAQQGLRKKLRKTNPSY